MKTINEFTKDFNNLIISNMVASTALGDKMPKCKNEKDYVAGATVSRGWSNYCPNCQTSGSLIVNNY